MILKFKVAWSAYSVGQTIRPQSGVLAQWLVDHGYADRVAGSAVARAPAERSVPPAGRPRRSKESACRTSS